MGFTSRGKKICYFRTLLAHVENVLEAATSAICRDVLHQREDSAYLTHFCKLKYIITIMITFKLI